MSDLQCTLFIRSLRITLFILSFLKGSSMPSSWSLYLCGKMIILKFKLKVENYKNQAKTIKRRFIVATKEWSNDKTKQSNRIIFNQKRKQGLWWWFYFTTWCSNRWVKGTSKRAKKTRAKLACGFSPNTTPWVILLLSHWYCLLYQLKLVLNIFKVCWKWCASQICATYTKNHLCDTCLYHIR